MDAGEINPEVLLLAFAAGTELFDRLQVLPEAGDSTPAGSKERGRRALLSLGRVDVACFTIDRGSFEYLESFENAHPSGIN
jgi:hypothetical protein